MAAPIGNWQRELEDILKKIKSESGCHLLHASKNDVGQFNILAKQHLIDDIPWMSAYFENCHRLNEKSTEKTCKARQDGNKYFQKKQYQEACSLYTQAILNGPTNSQELALAFGNRSAALFHLAWYKACLTDVDEAMKQGFPELTKPVCVVFQACLTDVDEAMKQGFPELTRYKLLIRKLHCLTHLGGTRLQETCVIEATKAVNDSDCDVKKKDQLLKEIKQLELEAMERSSVKQEEECQTVPTVSHGNSHVLVQASAAVGLQCNDRQGRFLTASRDMKAGDTLIVERPFAAVLLPDHYDTHCHHCFVKHSYSFPCRQCSLVRYCSAECADDSWKNYHSVECPYLKLLHSVGIAHLSVRIVVVAGLAFLKDFRRSLASRGTEERVPGLDSRGQYCRNYLTVYELMTHATHMDTDDLLQYSLTALLLLKILQHSGWFNTDCSRPSLESQTHKQQPPDIQRTSSDDKCGETDTASCDSVTDASGNSSSSGTGRENVTTECTAGHERDSVDEDEAEAGDDVEVYIGQLLLRHIQQLVCNAHAITDLQCSEAMEGSSVEDLSQVRVATAIYPTASLMNHSCDPTIISSFHKDTLVVRAVKDVPKGGEIFNCYGPHYRRMGWRERQRCLQEQYFFTCLCPPCMDGDTSDALLYSYKCPSCCGPLVADQPTGYICQTCAHKAASIDTDSDSRASHLFQQALALLHNNRVEEAVPVVKTCLQLRAGLLYKHNKDLSQTQDCLARLCAMLGCFEESAVYLRASIETVKVIYGADSIEAGNELQKLSEILISAQNWPQALAATQEALNVFSLHYGKGHDKTKELISASKQLMDIIGK